ncbi:hypothetical protein CR513_12233, partial [Mucuna pruriens]
MEVFLAKRDRGENPTMAILTNTYYSLDYYGERKEGSLRCCTHLLYLWLTAHLFHNKGKTTCPIEDFKWSWIGTMTKEQWVKHLSKASERTIRWYPPWNEPEQAEYPMIRAPSKEVMTPFVIHRSRAHKEECYRKVRQAWNNVTRRGAKSRTRSCGTSSSYKTWLRDRTRLIGLPRTHDQRTDQEVRVYEVQETLKIEELKDTLKQMRAEQEVLKRKLVASLKDAH